MRTQDDINNYHPTRAGIIFQFLQETSTGTFNNQTDWGFEVRNRVEDIKTPRWAKVVRVGPDVPSHIKEGTFILIDKLMWSDPFKVDEVKWYSTAHDRLLAVSEVEPTGLL